MILQKKDFCLQETLISSSLVKFYKDRQLVRDYLICLRCIKVGAFGDRLYSSNTSI